jgi:hypothetical protein
MFSLLRRILRIEPGVTLGQWIYDRFANNWQSIIALFLGLGGMSYLAAVTDWLRAWGPVAWGTIGLVSALIIAIGISLFSYLRSAKEAADARAILDKTVSKSPDRVNTLNNEFRSL